MVTECVPVSCPIESYSGSSCNCCDAVYNCCHRIRISLQVLVLLLLLMALVLSSWLGGGCFVTAVVVISVVMVDE